MSGLMNLFGNNSAPDSNDSLKYSAPKEPKKKQKASASTSENKTDTGSSAPTATATASNSSGPTPKTVGPSKLLVSSSVRLFRLNPTTRGYDAVEGGGLLGCIIMGSGLTFQFLIYNAQKQPQAGIKLTPTFEYTVAGLYLSFSDTNNNYFSVLFDSAETMFALLKTLSSVIVHLQSYNGDLGELPNLKRSLPPAADQTSEDTTVLMTGMTAGIYYSIWEIGDLTDYPSDIVNAAPLVQNKEPDDLLKVKLSDAEEFLPGLSTALSGHKRGDRFVLAIPPKTLASKSVLKPLFEANKKKNEYAYLFIIIEISKIKSSSSSAAAPPAQPTVPEKKHDTLPEERNETPVTQASTADNHNISSRMAKMAAASGGGNTLALAGIITHKVGFESPITETKKAVSFKDHPDTVSPIPIVPIPVKQQQQIDPSPTPITSAQSVTTPVKVTQTPQSAANVPQQQQQQQYQQIQSQPLQNTSPNQNQPQQQQQQQYQSYSNATSSIPQTTNQPDMNQSAFAQQFNNTMMIVQQSLMQLHTKLDQVGMQVTNVYSMQQQSQTTQQQMTMTLQTLSTATVSGGNAVTGGQNGNNPNANAMMMGMNPMGMMNPMMGGGYHPMMFSQPGYHNPYNMYGAPMSPTPMTSGGNLTSSNPQLKYKSDEIVSNVSFLLQQYELLKQENADLKNKITTVTTTPSTPPVSISMVKELEGKINTLEEEKRQLQAEKDQIKNENHLLQQEKEKFVKTVAEKTAEIDHMETSTKFKSLLQQQINAATSPLQTEVQELTQGKASIQKLLEEEKRKVVALEQEVNSLKASKSTSENTGNNEVEQTLRQQISELQALLTSLQQQLGQKDQEIATLQQQKNHSDGNNGDDNNNKFTVDDIKGMMSDIYKLSMATFLTEEEVNSFEEENIRTHTIQLVKTILKRLKDVLRQVTTDRLG